MKLLKLIVFSALLFVGCMKNDKPKPMENISKKMIIAHRGASGYLPEHTLEAKAMAYAMNPDFIEQDLVLSKDDVPIVIHDIHLDAVTDVAEKFPDRKREDGKFYVIDFTFEELKQLDVSERFDPKTGKAVYQDRFPLWKSEFRLHSLQDEIEMIQGLNKSTGRQVGIYPEIKDPAFHRSEGKDISKIILKVLSDYGYTTKKDHCILQCFDVKELKRIRRELGSQLYLVQLIEFKQEEKLVEEYASYADGVGHWYKQMSPDFVQQAHQLGLQVHGYTFRADDLGNFGSFDLLLDYGFNTLGLDGVFTDFPDKALAFRHSLH